MRPSREPTPSLQYTTIRTISKIYLYYLTPRHSWVGLRCRSSLFYSRLIYSISWNSPNSHGTLAPLRWMCQPEPFLLWSGTCQIITILIISLAINTLIYKRGPFLSLRAVEPIHLATSEGFEPINLDCERVASKPFRLRGHIKSSLLTCSGLHN